jgi:hypothetical protein
MTIMIRPSFEAGRPAKATDLRPKAFLGLNGWKREWQNRIIGHGGRGVRG